MRFIFGAGGTGGHIYPALAIAKELTAMGHTASFIGNHDGMEAQLIPREGYIFHPIRVQKMSRQLRLSGILFPFRLLNSIASCWSYLGKSRPDAVICTGGFVSGPVAIAAIIRHIPLFFHESNSLPGITIKYLAKHSRMTFISWASSSEHIKNAPMELSGIPIFERKLPQGELNLPELGIDPAKPIILISGGSQGSVMINRAIDAAMAEMQAQGWQIIWQTGKNSFEEFSARHKGKPGVYLFDFSPQLPLFYKIASLAITRAGALTIAELQENHLPAILIPLPTAAENHQHFNAMELHSKGLAILLPQNQLNSSTLLANIHHLIDKRQSYIQNYQSVKPNTAAKDLSRRIVQLLGREETNAR